MKVFAVVYSEGFEKHAKECRSVTEAVRIVEAWAKRAIERGDGIPRILGVHLCPEPPPAVMSDTPAPMSPFAYRGPTGHESDGVPLVPVIPDSLEFVPGRTEGEMITYEEFRHEQVLVNQAARLGRRFRGVERGVITRNQPGPRGVRARWLKHMRQTLPRRDGN